MHVFVIRNQHQQYLGKQQNWLSGADAKLLYQTQYHDEALNTLIEVNAKDIELRGEILEVELNEKKQPVVEVDEGVRKKEKAMFGLSIEDSNY